MAKYVVEWSYRHPPLEWHSSTPGYCYSNRQAAVQHYVFYTYVKGSSTMVWKFRRTVKDLPTLDHFQQIGPEIKKSL